MDPLRAHAKALRRAKREREQPQPQQPEPGPLVSQGVRSEPPRRPGPSPDALLREMIAELRHRPKTIRIE